MVVLEVDGQLREVAASPVRGRDQQHVRLAAGCVQLERHVSVGQVDDPSFPDVCIDHAAQTGTPTPRDGQATRRPTCPAVSVGRRRPSRLDLS
jgi:hypothetical protein